MTRAEAWAAEVAKAAAAALRDAALSAPCPACGAAEGERCQWPPHGPSNIVHLSRAEAWRGREARP